MTLFQLYMLFRDIEIDCNNALKDNFQQRINKEISYEEYEYQRLHYEGARLGAETMFKKVREHIQKETESVNSQNS